MENEEMKNEERQNNPLLLTIREMDFSIRTSNCLRRAGVNTLEDLCKMTENEVKQVRNLGCNSLEEIKTKLAEHGLCLTKIEKYKARNTLDGISAGKHQQAVEALKFVNQYCESVFDEKSDGCNFCVFCPTNNGQRSCPLRGDFTATMFLAWSRRAKELERGESEE